MEEVMVEVVVVVERGKLMFGEEEVLIERRRLGACGMKVVRSTLYAVVVLTNVHLADCR